MGIGRACSAHEEMRYVNNIFVGNPEGKIPLGRTRCK
jgi:hypothetical protein